MDADTAMSNSPFWQGMRWVVWGGAAFLLLLPAIAMRFTTEVHWTMSDFVVMGTMLGIVCAAFEVAIRVARTHVYVVAAGIAVATGFLLTWVNLAVGIIGNENNPANGMFFGVVAIAFLSAMIAQLKPRGMARAMYATAAAQLLTAIATLVIAGGYIFVLTAIFVALWLLSAKLFDKAAEEQEAALGASG